eukprot:752632-Hanusia_phi.AAC.2
MDGTEKSRRGMGDLARISDMNRLSCMFQLSDCNSGDGVSTECVDLLVIGLDSCKNGTECHGQATGANSTAEVLIVGATGGPPYSGLYRYGNQYGYNIERADPLEAYGGNWPLYSPEACIAQAWLACEHEPEL